MEKAEETDSETTRVDWRAWWGVGAIVLALGTLAVFQEILWARSRIPSSQGMSVSDWLYAKRIPNGKEGEILVAGFGALAIPYFTREWRSATEAQDERWEWIRKQADKVGIEMAERPGWRVRKQRAHGALAVLGRDYPDLVTPVFMEMLSSTNRTMGIFGLGWMGTNHFGFLTNLIGTGSFDDASVAVSAIGAMGTNAAPAIDLVIDRSDRVMATNVDASIGGIFTLGHIGNGYPRAVSWLVSMLLHTNERVWFRSAFALGLMTNSYDRIAPELLRVARLPVTNGVDYGERPTVMLGRTGVSAREAVPLLLRRIRAAIEAEKYDPVPDPGMVRYYARFAAKYGGDAMGVVPLIDAEYVRRVKMMPGATGGGFGPGSSPAEAWLERIERYLLEIDPTWTKPVIK